MNKREREIGIERERERIFNWNPHPASIKSSINLFWTSLKPPVKWIKPKCFWLEIIKLKFCLILSILRWNCKVLKDSRKRIKDNFVEFRTDFDNFWTFSSFLDNFVDFWQVLKQTSDKFSVNHQRTRYFVYFDVFWPFWIKVWKFLNKFFFFLIYSNKFGHLGRILIGLKWNYIIFSQICWFLNFFCTILTCFD